ncbi:hypothetical protein JKP88DRAFT_241066 [Tribonema minus]|uniref:Uncharacterized protein n=1 Tax=Tribonema minus TaxID=303371 RepID=A0A836CIG3_9STRA|nr:hypothetical protein JKP88DRAFT_241066 [Tribonema minus]
MLKKTGIKKSLGSWFDTYARSARRVIAAARSASNTTPTGSALLNSAYPEWSKAMQQSVSQAAVAADGAKALGKAPVAPGYMPLGAQAPLLSDAYGYTNPIATTEDPNMLMSQADKSAGQAASAEYNAAAKAITFSAPNGTAGDGTDKVGVPGTDLKAAYGDNMKTMDMDKAMNDANAAMDNDPIKQPPLYDGPYDDDAVSLTSAYGNAFGDGSQAPKLTPQGVMDAATYQPGGFDNIGRSRVSGNPLLQGLAGPPGTYIGGAPTGLAGPPGTYIGGAHLGTQRRSSDDDYALGTKRRGEQDVAGVQFTSAINGHIGAVPQRQGATMDMSAIIGHIGAVPQRQGAPIEW